MHYFNPLCNLNFLKIIFFHLEKVHTYIYHYLKYLKLDLDVPSQMQMVRALLESERSFSYLNLQELSLVCSLFLKCVVSRLQVLSEASRKIVIDVDAYKSSKLFRKIAKQMDINHRLEKISTSNLPRPSHFSLA